MAAAQYPQRFGNYTLLKKIAQGGMAEIFLAQSQKDGRICALKLSNDEIDAAAWLVRQQDALQDAAAQPWSAVQPLVCSQWATLSAWLGNPGRRGTP